MFSPVESRGMLKWWSQTFACSRNLEMQTVKQQPRSWMGLSCDQVRVWHSCHSMKSAPGLSRCLVLVLCKFSVEFVFFFYQKRAET